MLADTRSVKKYSVKLASAIALSSRCTILENGVLPAFSLVHEKQKEDVIHVLSADGAISVLEIRYSVSLPGFEIMDSASDKLLGRLIRYESKKLGIARAEWELHDARGAEVCTIRERKFWFPVQVHEDTYFCPHIYNGYIQGRRAWSFRQTLDLQRLKVTFSKESILLLDPRLSMAAVAVFAFDCLQFIDPSVAWYGFIFGRRRGGIFRILDWF